jgi:hypothetical protein
MDLGIVADVPTRSGRTFPAEIVEEIAKAEGLFVYWSGEKQSLTNVIGKLDSFYVENGMLLGRGVVYKTKSTLNLKRLAHLLDVGGVRFALFGRGRVSAGNVVTKFEPERIVCGFEVKK